MNKSLTLLYLFELKLTIIFKFPSVYQKAISMNFEIISERIKLPVFEDPTATMSAYFARPLCTAKTPSVILCMGLDGLNQSMLNIASGLAENGYAVLVPDFFHRVAPDIQLQQKCSYQLQSSCLTRNLSRVEVTNDLIVAQRFLQGSDSTSEQMGIVGFCLGGHIAYLAATQFPFRLTVVFDPLSLTMEDFPLNQPKSTLELSSAIQKQRGKVICVWGTKNEEQTKDGRDKVKQALLDMKVKHQCFEYPNAGKGIFYEEQTSFDRVSKEQAWNELLKALRLELSPPHLGTHKNTSALKKRHVGLV